MSIVKPEGAPMSVPLKAIIVVAILLAELACAVFWPRISLHGPVLEESYRHAQRLAALAAWSREQTPDSKAAYDAEVTLLEQHMARRAQATLAVVLAMDAVGIYCFWKYAPTKKMA